MTGWFCYFEDADGQILRSEQCWESVDSAARWGRRILGNPSAYCLVDASNKICLVEALNQEASFTVEPSAGIDKNRCAAGDPA